jgi:hypothetical protein
VKLGATGKFLYGKLHAGDQKVTLVRFSQREEIEEIGP